jgi:hypothetical protein
MPAKYGSGRPCSLVLVRLGSTPRGSCSLASLRSLEAPKPIGSKVVGQEVAVGGVLERGLDDSVPPQAVNEIPGWRGHEAEVVGHPVAEAEAQEVAFEQRRGTLPRFTRFRATL